MSTIENRESTLVTETRRESQPVSTDTESEHKRPALKYVGTEDMIKVYGNPQWHRTNYEARRVIGRDAVVTAEGEPINFKPIEGVEKAYNYLMQRYVEYVVLLKLMEEVMESLIHPQKKILFRRFIEAVAGRVCELRHEMTKLARTNLHNLTGCVAELGLTPDDMTYGIPECMIQGRQEATELRERVLSVMLTTLGPPSTVDVHDSVSGNFLRRSSATQARRDSSATTGSGASRDSQNLTSIRERRDSTHTTDWKERKAKGRDGRDSLHAEPSRLNTVPSSTGAAGRKRKTSDPVPPSQSMKTPKKPPSINSEMNDFVNSRRYKEWLATPKFHQQVCMLQYQLRCYIAKRARWNTQKDGGALVYMEMPPANVDVVLKEEEASVFRQKCEEREAEYKLTLDNLREQFLPGSESTFDRWALTLNLKQWVLELRDLMGKFQPYPDLETGGCSVLFTDRTVAQIVEELDDMDDTDKKKKPSSKDDKKKKKEKDKGKGKGKKEKEEGFLWTMPLSASLPGLVRALQEYGSYWELKREDDNLEQRLDLQLAKEKVREEAEETVRHLVDAMLREEMERLRAIDREPPPKPDKKKDKKDKGKKGKKGKKDPLEGKSVEEVFQELVMAGIAVKPKQVSLDDFVGSHNMIDENRAPYRLPTAPDLKMALREMFGLPLCSSMIHANLELRNSVLLAGPPGVGKSLMAHGLARETGAGVLNLSPVNLVGKYQGKKQEDYLMNVLLKVSKAMEPTILLVDECHLMFPTKKARKRPEVDSDKPSRWAKMLVKLMKKLKPGDRTLLVGLTSEPFTAKTGPMCKMFQNIFVVPFPEYGSREALWSHYLGKLALARPHNINTSVLARLTEGYTGADIEKAVSQAFPPERREKRSRLRNEELLTALVKAYPDDEAPDREEWLNWYLSTPMIKARVDLLQSIVEEEEAAALAKQGKKK